MRQRIPRVAREFELDITSISEDGYGLASQNDREFLVLNGLPGEKVIAREYKRKRGLSYCEAIEILVKSSYRVEPKDEAYLSTSPFQNVTFEQENIIKKQSLQKHFSSIPRRGDLHYSNNQEEWNYRNKVEFSWYGFDSGEISLAFHKRGSSKGKIPVNESSILSKAINRTAKFIIDGIRKTGIEARELKTLIIRSNSYGETNAVIFTKNKEIPNILDFLDQIPDSIKGIHVVYSNPQSPASVWTEACHSLGSEYVEEKVLQNRYRYHINGFFQVNITMYEALLLDLRDYIIKNIQDYSSLDLIDLYAGVGSIGISVADLFQTVTGVENYPGSKELALYNASQAGLTNYSFIEENAEKVDLDLKENSVVILDPPRTGLHPSLVKLIREKLPKIIIYISCNPITQVRDLDGLIEVYDVEYSKAFNFYPKTPHLENIVVLNLRKDT